ncbi:hypothetical protein FRC12_000084 [Ceratobasidium sp. 428]|nr:hypothetical protein FRC12_000084 [Ceratobasidium sp. 428]
MSYGPAYPLSPPPFLSEDEVFQNFELLLDRAIANASNKGWLQSSGEPHVTVTGSALCLYYAAIASDTGRPSVLIVQVYGGIPKRLQYNTCPPSFGSLFHNWAELVPNVQALSEYQKAELEHIICSGTPAPLPPAIYSPNYPSSGYLTPSPVHMIAAALYALAQQITTCRAYRTQHRRARSVPNINTNSPWVAAMTLSPVEGISPLIQHPSPQSELGGSVFGYPQSASPPESHSPPASYSPAPSTESTAVYSPVLSPGSTNDRGIFVGGFLAPLERGVTLPAQGSTTLPMPSLQHFDSRDPSPMNDQRKRYTSAGPDYTTTRSYDPTSSTHSTATVISSRTPKSEVIGELQAHGCKDLTRSLNHSSFIPISRGGYGEVYSGTLWDGTPVAVKIMFSHDQYEESKHLKHTAREVHTWSKCDHPNVARLMGLADFRGQLAMVSRWMANGNLRNYVNKYPHVNRLELCTQVAGGLEYLHQIKIVHGDLKGANILMDSEWIPVLIDFGNAVQSNSTLQFTRNGTNQGMTMRWTAPELFDDSEVSYEADVYALGMTILEVFTGKEPYHSVKRDSAIVKAVSTDKKIPDRPPEIPEGTLWGDILWEILVNCWAHTPSERPTAASIHRSLKKISEGTFASAASHTQ